MSIDDCEICIEFNSAFSPDHYLLRGVPSEGRILKETKSFILVPDCAPLVPGHLLIFAVDHALSMADYLSEEIERISELSQLFNDYSEQYQTPAVMEHGSTLQVERDHPCISHAHLHLLPLNVEDLKGAFSLDTAGSNKSMAWVEMPSASGKEYVLIGSPDSIVIAEGWRPPSRQYPRSLVGRVLGLNSRDIYSDTCIMPNVVTTTISEWETYSDN